SVSNPRPNVGDVITYTVTLTDKGPGTASGVQVSDLLPAGLTFGSAAPSQGRYNIATGVWTVGTVTTPTPPTPLPQAPPARPGARPHAVSGSHTDPFALVKTNDSASPTLTPQQADRAPAKTVSNPPPNVGDTITYTITLTNNGPSTATGVIIDEPIPAGVSF